MVAWDSSRVISTLLLAVVLLVGSIYLPIWLTTTNSTFEKQQRAWVTSAAVQTQTLINKWTSIDFKGDTGLPGLVGFVGLQGPDGNKGKTGLTGGQGQPV